MIWLCLFGGINNWVSYVIYMYIILVTHFLYINTKYLITIAAKMGTMDYHRSLSWPCVQIMWTQGTNSRNIDIHKIVFCSTKVISDSFMKLISAWISQIYTQTSHARNATGKCQTPNPHKVKLHMLTWLLMQQQSMKCGPPPPSPYPVIQRFCICSVK